MWNDAMLWNVGRNTPLLEKDGGGMECWILLFFGCIFASTARTHTHHHTRAELVSICMASWHGANEKRVGEGEGGGDGVRGPRRFSWRQQCMHHSAARGIYHGWEYTTLLSEGEIQSFNHALNQDR